MKKDFKTRYSKGKELLKKAVANYYQTNSCACEHPRFIQIASINCRDFNEVFKSFETSILINLVKPYFTIRKLEEVHQYVNESHNEKWTCKHCNSEFLYGWSDFSIALERDFLSLIQLQATPKGKPIIEPIPLYVGLQGYSYPPKEVIQSVDYTSFENYILEK